MQTAKRAASDIGKPYEKPNRIDGGISANRITNARAINDQGHRLSNWVEDPPVGESGANDQCAMIALVRAMTRRVQGSECFGTRVDDLDRRMYVYDCIEDVITSADPLSGSRSRPKR